MEISIINLLRCTFVLVDKSLRQVPPNGAAMGKGGEQVQQDEGEAVAARGVGTEVEEVVEVVEEVEVVEVLEVAAVVEGVEVEVVEVEEELEEVEVVEEVG